MAKNFMSKLLSLEGAVTEQYDPFSHIIRSPSPSVNFTFGNTHGLPRGYSLVMYGPPKGGKTLLCNMIIGQLHRDDEEGIVVKFDTEMRERSQMTPTQAALWGIDLKRYAPYSVNSPALIFDRIEHEIAALCDDGAPIKLIIIDSITGIQGRREMNAESVDVQQIGDHALTIQTGLKRILAVQRKHNIAMILTAHVRAEMDALEQKRGNKVKMAASFGLQHHAEYFMMVEPNRNKDARSSLAGEEFLDEAKGDIRTNGDGEKTGHKIRVCMKDSSLGPKGRFGEFTLDYHKGLINTHEEVFLLGTNRGVIERPTNAMYVFGDKKWNGKPAMLEAIAADYELEAAILKEIKVRDLAGYYQADDHKAETTVEAE